MDFNTVKKNLWTKLMYSPFKVDVDECEEIAQEYKVLFTSRVYTLSFLSPRPPPLQITFLKTSIY